MNYIVSLILKMMPDEEDAFWAFVFVMLEKGWREFFLPNSNRLTMLLGELEEHIVVKHPKLFEHLSEFECFSIEAAFSSHVITLFIYDANLDTSISIFEMFLVFGSQVILDVLAFMVICTESKMLKLE